MMVCCVRTGRTLFGFGFGWVGLGYGVGILGRFGSDLITGLFGLLGIGFGDSWFTGFVQSAKQSGYSWVN